jgi:hypothetical protein
MGREQTVRNGVTGGFNAPRGNGVPYRRFHGRGNGFWARLPPSDKPVPPAPTPTPTPTPTPKPTGPVLASNPVPAPPTTPGSTLPGVDTCAAPSLSTMKAWRATYAATAIYIGGQMTGCGQSNNAADLDGTPYVTSAVWPNASRAEQYQGNKTVKVGGICSRSTPTWWPARWCASRRQVTLAARPNSIRDDRRGLLS